MNVVLRYACLLGLGFASIFAFVSAGSVTGQMMVASGDAALIHPRDVSVWVLGLFAMVSLFSVFRFVFSRLPFMIRDFYRDHKEKMATLAMMGIVCFVFVVL